MNMKRIWRIGGAVLAAGMASVLWTTGCEDDSLYDKVAIVPASIELHVGQAQVFRATGGQDYEWSFAPVDGRLGLNSTVGDTVVATALANTTDEETTNSVITLTCRLVIPGVTYVETNEAEHVAQAYISIR